MDLSRTWFRVKIVDKEESNEKIILYKFNDRINLSELLDIDKKDRYVDNVKFLEYVDVFGTQ